MPRAPLCIPYPFHMVWIFSFLLWDFLDMYTFWTDCQHKFWNLRPLFNLLICRSYSRWFHPWSLIWFLYEVAISLNALQIHKYCTTPYKKLIGHRTLKLVIINSNISRLNVFAKTFVFLAIMAVWSFISGICLHFDWRTFSLCIPL